MFFDEIVSCWELNRSVRLPFCLRFPEFVCCLREAITEASKRLNISGLKVKQQETIEGFLSAGRILLYFVPTEYGKSRCRFSCLPISFKSRSVGSLLCT